MSVTLFDLKLLAVIFMVIDHVGLFFFSEHLAFRLIGRLSFPIFAWLIVNGIEYSHNRRNYFLRLFAFALMSQFPYLLAFGAAIPGFSGLNIFFTLCLGFLAVQVYRVTEEKKVISDWIEGRKKNLDSLFRGNDRKSEKSLSAQILSGTLTFLLVGLCALAGSLLTVSYGAGGVLCVFLFYLFRKNIKAMFVSQLLIFIIFYTLPVFFIPSMNGNLVALIQPVGAMSVLLLAFYNHERGPKLQYFFYLFYPIHLVVLYFLTR